MPATGNGARLSVGLEVRTNPPTGDGHGQRIERKADRAGSLHHGDPSDDGSRSGKQGSFGGSGGMSTGEPGLGDSLFWRVEQSSPSRACRISRSVSEIIVLTSCSTQENQSFSWGSPSQRRTIERRSGSIGLPSLLAEIAGLADIRFTQHLGDRHGPIRFAAYAHGATAICGRSASLHGVSPDSGDGGAVGALGVAGRTPRRSRWASTICSISARRASWSRRCISGHWSCSVDPLAMADHKEATTRLLVERNCRSSCDRRVAISSRLPFRRRAKDVRPEVVPGNSGRLFNSQAVVSSNGPTSAGPLPHQGRLNVNALSKGALAARLLDRNSNWAVHAATIALLLRICNSVARGSRRTA